jgi:hypothetical protein
MRRTWRCGPRVPSPHQLGCIIATIATLPPGKWRHMNVIRVELAREFMWGDDVVLVAMDIAGLDIFTTAMNQAEQQGSARLDHGGVIHDFLVQDGAADIELHDARVVWRLDHAKAVEIIQDLTVLKDSGRPGHHYVDISKPTQTLVLSRDEYV